MADEADLVCLLSSLKPAFTSPESYFHPKNELYKDVLDNLKGLFDYSRQNDAIKAGNSCLNELMVQGFDEEQIWQQIELQNAPVVSETKKTIKSIKGLHDITILEDMADEIDIDNDDIDDDDDVNDYDDIEAMSDTEDNIIGNMMPASSSEDDDDENTTSKENNNNIISEDDNTKPSVQRNVYKKKQKKHKGPTVDDRFFKLSEMTEFLDKMDQQFERDRDRNVKDQSDDDEEEEVNLFGGLSSEEDDEEEEWGDIVENTAKLMKREVSQERNKLVSKVMYSDYFDPPGESNKNMSNKYDIEIDEDEMDEDMGESDGEDEDESNGEDEEGSELEENQVSDEEEHSLDKGKSLSQHEEQQSNLRKKIALLEKENLTKKPWQMSGETSSTARPINSLLEEDLNFDHTTAVAPPITEETTKELEDIIKQRIKDEAWDDVERKQKPVTQPFEYKKKLPLDQEKSKLSLSQLYEQEYVKQTETKDTSQEEQENPEHKEIKEIMNKLFVKLDALSNFHFTPKPLKPDVKIVTNTPAINMEEVAPVAVSDAMLLAPEETHAKKVEVKGDTEKTETDRKRERRSKKLRQRMKAKDKEKKSKLMKKLKPGLGNKYAKKKALERIEKESKTTKSISVIKDDAGEKALKSSSAFFSRLHDEVKNQVAGSKKLKIDKKSSKRSTSKLRL